MCRTPCFFFNAAETNAEMSLNFKYQNEFQKFCIKDFTMPLAQVLIITSFSELCSGPEVDVYMKPSLGDLVRIHLALHTCSSMIFMNDFKIETWACPIFKLDGIFPVG